MSQIPCFLCGKQLDRRIDKNEKPYFVCDPCGMQAFIRRKLGIEKLDELIRAVQKRGTHFRKHADSLFEIQAVLAEIDSVKSEIENSITKSACSFPTRTKLLRKRR